MTYECAAINAHLHWSKVELENLKKNREKVSPERHSIIDQRIKFLEEELNKDFSFKKKIILPSKL